MHPCCSIVGVRLLISRGLLDFKDVVKDNQVVVKSDDIFICLKQKMKRTKVALSPQIRERFGGIFKQLIIREDIVRIKGLFEEHPSAENRAILQKAQAEFKQYLHYEEEFWRQKAGVQRFTEGDKNTKFFHSLVKGRRKRLQIKRILKRDGIWAEHSEEVAGETVAFFQDQFTSAETETDLF